MTPGNPTSRDQLAKVVQDIVATLARLRITIDPDATDDLSSCAGFDSLIEARLVRHISQAFDIRVPDTSILSGQTRSLWGLADLVLEQQTPAILNADAILPGADATIAKTLSISAGGHLSAAKNPAALSRVSAICAQMIDTAQSEDKPVLLQIDAGHGARSLACFIVAARRGMPVSMLGGLNLPPDSPCRLAHPDRPLRDDTACVQPTSGTSGQPDLIEWAWPMLARSIRRTRLAGACGPDSRIVSLAGLHHTMGLAVSALPAMQTGAGLILCDPRAALHAPEAFVDAIAQTRSTHIVAAPALLAELADLGMPTDAVQETALQSVKRFWVAGERLQADLMDRISERLGAYGLSRDALRANYGMTEIAGAISFSENGTRPRISTDTGIFLSVGRPVAGLTVSIMRDGRAQPQGKPGEIVVEQDGMPPLHTGDEGIIEAGQLFWTARLSHQININGRRLDPSEFARPVSGVMPEGARAFAAVALPPDQGPGVALIVEAAEENGQADALRAACFEALGVSPRIVLFVQPNTIPRTASGKIRHVAAAKLLPANDRVPQV